MDALKSCTHAELTYEDYYVKYYPKVVRYIARKISDPAAAEDMAMDVFVVCWEKFSSFDPQKATFGTWLYVIVANKLKNFYRDRKNFEEIDENLCLPGSFEDSLLTAAHLGMLRCELHEALVSLPPLQQEIIVGKYFQNLTSSEIALKTGLSPGNVRVQLFRGIKKLKAHFDSRNIGWE